MPACRQCVKDVKEQISWGCFQQRSSLTKCCGGGAEVEDDTARGKGGGALPCTIIVMMSVVTV